MFKITYTHVVQPESSFLEKIEITGNVAKIKMKQSNAVYSYAITDNQRKYILNAAKNKERIGKWFRKNIGNNQLLSKTIPA